MSRDDYFYDLAKEGAHMREIEAEEDRQLRETPYRIIYPNGGEEPRSVRWPREPGFSMIEDEIGPLFAPDHFEHVSVFWNGAYTDLFVSELGAINGSPVNPKATEIYHENMRQHNPEGYLALGEAMPRIYGTAVLFSRRVWF
jgi:hypothetical protein